MWSIKISFIKLIIYFIVFMYVHIIIHELGHLIFGLITGYKFVSFRIFQFMILKTESEFKIKRLKVVGTAGQCLVSPPYIIDGRIPVVLYNLGGVILNLFFSVPALILFVVLKTNNSYLLFAYVGISCAITNGIPIPMGLVFNDGYNAVSLVRSKRARLSFWIQLKVNEELSRGKRLKDMPENWFTLPEYDDMKKNSINLAIGIFRCNWFIDLNDLESANNLMINILYGINKMPDIYRKLLICDRIYCELMMGNISKATELLDNKQKHFAKYMKNFPSVLRVLYAYSLIVEKNEENAKKIKIDFDKIKGSYPFEGEIESEQELIKKVDKYYYNNTKN